MGRKDSDAWGGAPGTGAPVPAVDRVSADFVIPVQESPSVPASRTVRPAVHAPVPSSPVGASSSGPRSLTFDVIDSEEVEAYPSDGGDRTSEPGRADPRPPRDDDPPTRSLRLREGLEPPPRDKRIGELLVGKYRLDKLIGKGGMGRVYLGVQYPLNRAVAVKILNPEFQRKDPQFVRRFFLEAATAARLNHPNTITVFDYGETERGELFIAMEYLNGRPLSRVLSADGPFGAERAIYVGMQIARALREAHAKGIIHRDLKPGNIMLLEEGDDADFVKVLDFGLVKLFNPGAPGSAHPLGSLTPTTMDGDDPSPMEGEVTRAGMFLGSPKYMSPEQIQGHDLDVRTDIYSLGVILYQMITGRPPFRGSTSVEIIYKHVNEPVPPLHEAHPDADAPPELERVVLRCLSKSREERFSSMGDLLQALKEVRRTVAGGGSLSQSGSLLDAPPARRDVTDSVAAEAPSRSSSLPPSASSVPPEAPSTPRVSSLPPVRTFSMPRSHSTTPPRMEASFLDRAVVGEDTIAGKKGSAIGRVLPMIGGAALVLALGATAYVLSSQAEREGAPQDPTAATASPSKPIAPIAAAPVVKPSAPLEARVSFSSNPDGAEVYEHGAFLGTTPFEKALPRGDGQPDSRTFVFKRAGQLDEELTERIDGDRVKIHASLRAVPPVVAPTRFAEPRKPAAAKRPKKGEDSDYKENPY